MKSFSVKKAFARFSSQPRPRSVSDDIHRPDPAARRGFLPHEHPCPRHHSKLQPYDFMKQWA